MMGVSKIGIPSGMVISHAFDGENDDCPMDLEVTNFQTRIHQGRKMTQEEVAANYLFDMQGQ